MFYSDIFSCMFKFLKYHRQSVILSKLARSSQILVDRERSKRLAETSDLQCTIKSQSDTIRSMHNEIFKFMVDKDNELHQLQNKMLQTQREMKLTITKLEEKSFESRMQLQETVRTLLFSQNKFNAHGAVEYIKLFILEGVRHLPCTASDLSYSLLHYSKFGLFFNSAIQENKMDHNKVKVSLLGLWQRVRDTQKHECVHKDKLSISISHSEWSDEEVFCLCAMFHFFTVPYTRIDEQGWTLGDYYFWNCK